MLEINIPGDYSLAYFQVIDESCRVVAEGSKVHLVASSSEKKHVVEREEKVSRRLVNSRNERAPSAGDTLHIKGDTMGMVQ